MKQETLKTVALIVGVAIILAGFIYVLNILLLSSKSRITPVDASFLEGMFLVLSGALFLIGSKGISRASQKAVSLAAAAGAISDGTIGPSEIYRQDAWKPKGYMRIGLTLILAGTILLIIYFTSL